MVFLPLCPKQVIQFRVRLSTGYCLLSETGSVFFVGFFVLNRVRVDEQYYVLHIVYLTRRMK